MIKRPKTWVCLVVLVLFPMVTTAEDGTTLLTVGTDGGVLVTDGEPAVAIVGVSGTAGHRRSLANSQYMDVTAAVSVDWVDLSQIADREFLGILWGVRRPRGRLEAEGRLLSGLSSDQEGSPFLAPQWGLEYRWGSAPVAPWVRYGGSLRSEAGSDGDFFSESLGVGINYQSNIRTKIALSGDAGWVHWPETPLLDSGGGTISENRNDLILGGAITVSHFLGYYTDYQTGLRGEWLGSTANRWVDSLESHSEDRLSAHWYSEINWSPRASLDFGVSGSVTGYLYVDRAALDRTDSPLAEELKLLTAAGSLRADWTPDQRTHIVFSGTFSQTLSNEPDSRDASLEARVGVEVAIQPR